MQIASERKSSRRNEPSQLQIKIEKRIFLTKFLRSVYLYIFTALPSKCRTNSWNFRKHFVNRVNTVYCSMPHTIHTPSYLPSSCYKRLGPWLSSLAPWPSRGSRSTTSSGPCWCCSEECNALLNSIWERRAFSSKSLSTSTNGR